METRSSRKAGAKISAPNRSGAFVTSPSGLAITYSILSADALLAEVAGAYAIGTPVACHLLLPSMNDTYLLTTRDEHHIVRVYRTRWRTVSDIAYELDLLIHLAAKGVSVSVPIAARDGSLCHPLPAPEGTRYLVLFTYAKGRHMPWAEEKHSHLAGRMLAMIHAASDDFVSRHARRSLDLEYLIDRPLAAIRPFLAHRPGDWTYLEGVAARLRDRIATAAAAGLDWGVCHGDFGGGNIHLFGTDTLTVFDFDLCGPGWRAYDIAGVQDVATGPNQAEIWDSFIEGYTQVRSLAAADLAAGPLFRVTRHLFRLGLQADNVPDWGVSRVSDSNINRELTLLREWQAEVGEDE